MAAMCFPVLLALASFPQATDDGDEAQARFAPPVRLLAGDAPMGEGRLYPSPALYDLDGDGVDELILGDLRGVLTVSKRRTGDGPQGWSEASALKGAGGDDLKFHNW